MYFVSNAIHICEKELGKEYLCLQRARNMQDIWQLLITQGKRDIVVKQPIR